MPCVCYGQSLVAVVYSHLPWEGQDAGWQGVSVQLDAHRVFLQQTLLTVVTEGAVSEKHQPVSVAFAYQGEEQVSMWAQKDQRWPAGHLQFMPEMRLTVVHHWVADVVTKHSTANVVQDL